MGKSKKSRDDVSSLINNKFSRQFTPPVSAFQPTQPATEARPKFYTHSYRSYTDVEIKRPALIESLPEKISEMSSVDFFHHILPPLPDKLERNLDKIFQNLKDDRHYLDDVGRWAGFPVDPSRNRHREDKVFQPLESIFDAVVDQAKKLIPGLKQNFKLTLRGNSTPDWDRGDATRPDGHLMITSKALATMQKKMRKKMLASGWKEKQTEVDHDPMETAAAGKPKISPHQMTAPEEFKKKKNSDNADDDARKLLFNMSNILTVDPCRRFVFGLTIEDRSLCLWVLHRGSFMKSTSFDFLKDGRHLVRLFLSFAFCSPGEMGWDPSITFSHFNKEGQRQYNVLINGKVYKTISVLFDHGADNPLGRALRIWIVEDAYGNRHVLKDYWLEFGRTQEHIIYNSILEDVKQMEPGKQVVDLVEECLLKPISSGLVMVSGQVDDTETMILRGYDIRKAKLVDLVTPPRHTPAERQSFGYTIPGDQDRFPRDPDLEEPGHFQRVSHYSAATRRQHYRIVFEQVGVTICDEINLENLIIALLNVVMALSAIHSAGWVHRDISGGNLYTYCKPDGKQTGLIGDLEYAKRFSSQSSHAVRTGTPFFMACEALTHSFLFQSSEFPTIHSTKPTFLTEVKPPQAPATAVAEPDKAVFVYNPLHDLESVWWVLVYVLFHNHCDPGPPRVYPENRRRTLNTLFNGELSNNQRLPFFKVPNFTNCVCQDLEFLIEPVKSFAKTLRGAYTTAEKDYPTISPIPQHIIHNDFSAAFHQGVFKSAAGKTLYSYQKRKQDMYKNADQKRLSELESEPVRKKKARVK